MKKKGAPFKKNELKTTSVTLRFPHYWNNWLKKHTVNKTKFIKIAVINSDPELKLAALRAGEKYSDMDFDKELEELKK